MRLPFGTANGVTGLLKSGWMLSAKCRSSWKTLRPDRRFCVTSAYGFLKAAQVRVAEDSFEDFDEVCGEVPLEQVEPSAELGDEVCQVFRRNVVVLLLEHLLNQVSSLLFDLRLDYRMDF